MYNRPAFERAALAPKRQVIRVGKIFIKRDIRNRTFVLLDEFYVGDADLRFSFYDRRSYRRQGFQQKRLLLRQPFHIFAPFGPDQLF